MNFDRRAALAALASATLAPAALAAPRKPPAKAVPPGVWAEVDRLAQKIVDGRLSPGVSICVTKHGRTIYDRSPGLANIETATPMTARSVCRIGSITKQFTATAILLLAEDGQLHLDDALSLYLPDFPRAKDLPLRRILSHTAGLGSYTDEPLPQFFKDMRADRSMSEMVALAATHPATLASEPGTAWKYSNTGYVLLGAVVERASGKPYAQVLAERIFRPLGLADTAVDRDTDVVPRRAAGYTGDPKAASGFDNAAFISMTYPGGAGCLRSTAADLCVWHTALLGGRVLKPQSLTAMTTPAVLNDGKLPTVSGPKGPVTIHYAFGLSIGDVPGHRSIGHDGGIPGFQSHLLSLPDEGVTLAVIRNCDGSPGSSAAADEARASNDLNAAVLKAALAA